MLPELARLTAHNVPEYVVEAAARFFESGDPGPPRKIKKIAYMMGSERIGEAVLGEGWSDRTCQLVRFFTHFSEGPPVCHNYLIKILAYAHDSSKGVTNEIAARVIEEVESAHGSIQDFIEWYLRWGNPHELNWELGAGPGAADPFVSPVANFVLRHVTVAHAVHLSHARGFFSVLAVQRPEIVRAWCELTAKSPFYSMSEVWKVIIMASKDYDDLCLKCCEEVAKNVPAESVAILGHLNEARGGSHAVDPMDVVRKNPTAVLEEDTLKYVMKHHPSEVVPLLARACADPAVDDYLLYFDATIFQRSFVMAYECWDAGGSEVLKNLLATVHIDGIETLLTEVFKKLKPAHYPVLREGILNRVKGSDAKEQREVWKWVAVRYTEAFLPEFEEMLSGKSKPLREFAAKALAKVKKKDGLGMGTALLGSEKPEERLGGIAILQKMADKAALPLLEAALAKDQPKEVREALLKAIPACGGKVKDEKKELPVAGNLAELEASLAKQAAKMKLPGVGWFKALDLPPLFATDGSELSKEATTFLVATQAKQKEMEAAAEIAPLLAHIDRAKSTPFAMELIAGFLGSSQAAGDRWALTLGTLTGDMRVLPPLVQQIHKWCKGTRGKLAEFAAQAIALLPGNEPLATLESLANRYRTKPKSLGKAAALAFAAAADARGMTPEELSDEVAPDLGFDAEGKRLFVWEKGKANAELGADFSLTWSDPDSDKSWKSLPTSASPEVKAEVKDLTKLLKEVVAEQSARLEMAMVCQRRWTAARWRELYENHPVLRLITGGLVWGIYDGSGTLLRTFRRYPNGLLANATGDLEELPECDAKIAIVHPLELDGAALDAWRAHLARFKVVPPFPQIGRPVEQPDPLQGNRKELGMAMRKEVQAMDLESRSKKRGWFRAPLVEGDAIPSVFKPFPGLGFEAMLITAGFSTMNWGGYPVELRGAYFVEAGSVERGIYNDDQVKASDPKVLQFDKIPAVVWSEVVCDLKVILGESSK